MEKSITASYESLPKVAKIVLQIFFGAIIGGVYRIIKYTETKQTATLVAGLLFLLTFLGNLVAWAVDLFTEIASNKITFFAD